MTKSANRSQPADPVDIADGIPDRQSKPQRWRWLVIAAVLALWIAFLIYLSMTSANGRL